MLYSLQYVFIKNSTCCSDNLLLVGISRATLSKFLSGQRKYLRIDIIEYICEGLNIKLKEFFDDKIFDNIERED